MNHFLGFAVHHPDDRSLRVAIHDEGKFAVHAEVLCRVDRFHRLNQLPILGGNFLCGGNSRDGDMLRVLLYWADFHEISLAILFGQKIKTYTAFPATADHVHVRLCLSMLLAAGIALGQQKAPAQAMQESLAQQRLSIEKQLRAISSSSFFTLPPPAPIDELLPTSADCDPVPDEQLKSMIEETAKSESIASELLRSVIRQESGARPCAVSSKGAQGLMQLMPATSQQFGVADPFDPKQNLQAGAKYLKQLLDRYGGDVPKALAAYNAGPGRVDQAGAIPSIPETVRYVSSILATLPH